MTQSKYEMISVEEALRIVLAQVQPLTAALVPLQDAQSLVMAESVLASEDMPPFAAAGVDGFA
ncbi:MAG: molybdopterin molybdenumtransferase MoeA, partial [Chloroflexi bacterium]